MEHFMVHHIVLPPVTNAYVKKVKCRSFLIQLHVSTIQFTNDEENFAQLNGYFWTNFGRTGNSNSPQSIFWPPWNTFTTSTNTSLHLTPENTKQRKNYRGKLFCDFWDKIGYTF